VPITIEPMTAKELLLQEAPRWSEHDAEVALRAVEHEHEDKPGDIVDEWGNLDAQTDALFAATMKDLAEEERAAGFGPWKREPSS
jgi:hypothetical protein